MRACVLGLCCVVFLACSAPDSAPPFRFESIEVAGMGGTPSIAGNPAVAGAIASSGASGMPVVSGGSDAGGASGTAGALPQPNAFTGAPAFVSAPVALSAAQQMPTGGSPTKTQCLSCHTGNAKASPLLSGGTVFADAAATAPAVDYEVRIVDTSTNQAYSAHSDANGNFWIEPGATSANGPFLIGVRNGTEVRAMPLVQRGLECNGSACHGGKQGPVHVP